MRELAHDLGTFLTVSAGCCDLVERYLDEAQKSLNAARHQLKQAREAQRHEMEMVREAASMERPAASPIRLAEFVDGEWASLQSLLGDEVIFSSLVPSYLRPVMAAPVTLKRVFSNLAKNAQAALAGVHEACFSIAAREVGEEMTIVVSDNGCGMSAETLERVNAGECVSTKPGHPGLGMRSVRRGIQECGGRLTIASTPGHGTTFIIYLPLSGMTGA
jgi:signal transduction histidine kinase